MYNAIAQHASFFVVLTLLSHLHCLLSYFCMLLISSQGFCLDAESNGSYIKQLQLVSFLAWTSEIGLFGTILETFTALPRFPLNLYGVKGCAIFFIMGLFFYTKWHDFQLVPIYTSTQTGVVFSLLPYKYGHWCDFFYQKGNRNRLFSASS